MATVAEFQKLVGTEVGVSDWVELDQPMVSAFADLTGDDQWIHTDSERASSTPFGGTIAHGFLMLSMFPALYMGSGAPLLDGMKMVVNAGGNRFRFITPVRTGRRVRARFKLLAFDEIEAGRYRETVEMLVEIEGEAKPAATAEMVVQMMT